MSEDSMLMLIAFILGWFLSRQMGNGFSVGGEGDIQKCKDKPGNVPGKTYKINYCSQWCGMPYKSPLNKEQNVLSDWSKCGIQTDYPYTCDCTGCGTCTDEI